jgi:hypothetical protein
MIIVKQYSSATSGTVTISDTKQDVHLIHDGSILTATLTVTFPPNPVDGQEFGISSGNGVTSLTNTSLRTIVGAATSLASGGFASYIYDATSDKWFRK